MLSGTAASGVLAGAGIRAARAAEPKRGGLLRVGFGNGSTVDDLDPSRVGEAFKVTLVRGTLRNNLTEINPAGELVPELAESWESSPDAKTWSFKIRRGVVFHNGKPLTPQDVVASIDYHRGETNRSGARSLLADIEELRADGPNAILVHLRHGNADFPFYTSIFQLQICPLVDGKPDVLSGNGTGPYVLKEFAPGVRASGSRNPNYFRTDKAFFDAFEFRALLDATARTNALLT
ncbi:MAG: peptide ABC transporter substrate-binding protein, partial [Acetobacteraceae bacterium]|nr:peptide ABC transporter substrate-binding protein [Acetobacteraceae bacterium]